MYKLIFTNEYGHDEVDYFEGSWFDLQEQIRFLRECGCTDIVATQIDAPYITEEATEHKYAISYITTTGETEFDVVERTRSGFMELIGQLKSIGFTILDYAEIA